MMFWFNLLLKIQKLHAIDLTNTTQERQRRFVLILRFISSIFFYYQLTKKEDSKAFFECHFSMDKFLHVCCNRDPNCKFPQKINTFLIYINMSFLLYYKFITNQTQVIKTFLALLFILECSLLVNSKTLSNGVCYVQSVEYGSYWEEIII